MIMLLLYSQYSSIFLYQILSIVHDELALVIFTAFFDIYLESVNLEIDALTLRAFHILLLVMRDSLLLSLYLVL